MKCLVYVSESTSESTERVPPDLTTILQSSRSRNKKSGITGLLTYRKRRYLQIIEGEDSAVDQLFSAIKADSRHRRVQIILDIATQVRSFPRWHMKLVPVLSDELDVLKFFSRHSLSLKKIPPIKLDLLSYFLERSVIEISTQSARKNENPFLAYDLMLDDWPNFSKVAPSNQLIEVCAELIKGAISYPNLLQSTPGATQEQVLYELGRLDDLGLLIKIPSKNSALRQNDSIYRKLRTLLSRQH